MSGRKATPKFYAAQLMDAPDVMAETILVRAKDRDEAWDVAYRVAADLNERRGRECTVQRVSIRPVELDELEAQS